MNSVIQAKIIQVKKWSMDNGMSGVTVLMTQRSENSNTIGEDVMKASGELGLFEKMRNHPVPAEYNVTVAMKPGAQNKVTLDIKDVAPIAASKPKQ